MDLKKLKQSLPKGYYKQAAKDLNRCQTTIFGMMNGSIPMSDETLEYFLAMAETNTMRRRELEKRVDKL